MAIWRPSPGPDTGISGTHQNITALYGRGPKHCANSWQKSRSLRTRIAGKIRRSRKRRPCRSGRSDQRQRATGWNARVAARLQMRISMPATAIPSHWTIAAIQSGERVTFDEAKQQVMAGAHPWPRVQGRTVCLDTTRRSKDRISAEISVCVYRLAAEICRRHG